MYTDALIEAQRLVLVWNAAMHHSGIPVETDEGFQALMRVAPAHFQNFLAGAAFASPAEAPLSPLIESVEMLNGATGMLV